MIGWCHSHSHLIGSRLPLFHSARNARRGDSRTCTSVARKLSWGPQRTCAAHFLVSAPVDWQEA
eukprot:366474-Chlamydomonas_euryale.AAC.18